jgi:DHA3 family tetracycline resistance protein-like MFS transporter
MPSRRASPERAWLVYRAGFGFSLFMGVTTFTLSLIDRLGAGQLTLALTGTVLEITYTLSEVPTGVLADRYGRKRSVVIGLFVLAIGFNLTAVPNLAVVIGAQVLWGIGWTCISGADVAWITDEVGEDAARPLYAAGTRAELLASVVGIAAGAALGQLSLWLPLVVGGAGFALLATWLVARMAETTPARTHEDRLTVAETVRRTRASVRVRPAVAVALAVMVAAGFAGEGVDRLWQFHLVADEAGARSTVLIVAALFAAGLLLGAGAAAVVGRRLDDPDPRLPARLLSWANYGVAASVVLLAVAPLPVAAAGFVACQALRHACEPLIYAWVNRGADASVRATLNSLVGQSESVGEIAGGPILGGIAATGGTGPALGVSAAVFATGGLVARWRRTLEEPVAREIGAGP